MRIHRSMLSFGLLLVIAFQPIAAQQDVAGEWTGSIQIPGMNLEIAVNLVNEGDTWSGEIDIPAQNTRDFELADVTVSDSDISFRMPGVPGDPTFHGSLSDDRDTISGNFTQGAQSFPFEIRRVSSVEMEQESARLEALADSVRAFVAAAKDSMNVPGLAVAILHKGDVVLSQGFGYRDVENEIPVTENTLFAIGSSSKAFTATTVGTLVADGEIEWDEPLQNYLPDFRLYDSYATEKMTPRDLLTHRSGLPRHDLLWYGSDLTREQMYERLRYLEPSAELRERWQYQNLMFLTAGILVERMTGSTWEEQVKSRIFDPLGMTHSNFSVVESQQSDDFAFGYKPVDDGVERMDFRDISQIGPAGSINSNVVDMIKWVRFQLEKGKVNDNEIIPEAVLAEIHTPQFLVAGRGNREIPFTMYAMGWFVQPYRGRVLVQHGGNIDGFSALVSFFPADDLGLVVLTNRNGTGLPALIQNRVADLYLDLERIDWIARATPNRSTDEEESDEPEEEENTKSDEEGRVTGTSPSHPLKDYVGKYHHPAYGDMLVELVGDSLHVSYNLFSDVVEHWHYDVFNFATVEGIELKIQFESNPEGEITGLLAPLEASVDRIEFMRKADDKLLDASYLEQFVGSYDYQGLQRVKIAFDGNRLTATLPNQPVYELVPTQELVFDMKGLDGYSVRFVEQEGLMVRLTFRQPNGNFTFNRVDEND